MAGHWWVLIVLAVFLVVLLAFHIPIILVRRKQGGIVQDSTNWKWRWEASDYLSVGLAGIALVPTAMEFSRASTVTEYRTKLPRIHNSVNLYVCEANHRLFVERAKDWQDTKPAIDWLAKAIEMLKRSEKVKMEGVELLRSSRFDDANTCFNQTLSIYDGLRAHFSQPYDKSIPFSNDNIELLTRLDQDVSDIREIQDLGRRMSKGDGELVAAFFSPWFLCIALAVRIAKVSSKVLVKEAK